MSRIVFDSCAVGCGAVEYDDTIGIPVFDDAVTVGEARGRCASISQICGVISVQNAKFGPLAAGLENGVSKTKTHSAAECGLGYFGHGDDDRVSCLFVKLGRIGMGKTAHVTGVFNYGELHA